MVKTESLSSDLDLVRELEQLKIKQKLLIESLSKKNKSVEEDLLHEINRKLEFLVNIFKEATNDEHDKEQILKLDSIIQTVETSFKTIEENLSAKIDSVKSEMKSFQEEYEGKIEELGSKKIESKVESLTPPPKPPSPQEDVKDSSKDKGKITWFKK